MTTKDYLNLAIRVNRTIQSKLSELHQLKELSLSVSSVENKEKVQTTPDPDKIGSAIAKIDQMEREIDNKIDEYVKIRDKIMVQIADISDDKYYDVLFSKYIENKTLERIAGEIQRSFRQILRLHSEALQAFEKQYGEEYLSLNGLSDVLEMS